MSDATESPTILHGHYQVERAIGRGAMGLVYLARDTRIGRLVALKTLHLDRQRFEDESAEREYAERFRREVRLAGSLSHPNIVTLYDAGYEEGKFTFIAMEYVEGESVASLVRRNGPLSADATARVMSDVFEGLRAAHALGIVHRDIKSANILISLDGRAKITDFGVARTAESELTAAGQILGTPHYIAPEVVIGQGADPRSDLFSAGVVMFEMLTASKPFEGRDLTDVLYNIVHQPAPALLALRRDLPAWCEPFLQRLLAKNPDERFPSATAAVTELRKLTFPEKSFDDTPINIPVERELSPDETPTTPLETPSFVAIPRTFLHPISPALGYALVAVLTISFIVSVVLIARQIDDSPTASIPLGLIDEFERKEAILREARILYDAEAYEESLERYDAYLRKYSWSTVAKDERDRAYSAWRATLEKQNEQKQSRPTRVTKRAAAQSSESLEPQQPPQPPKKSAWERFKGIFRRR